MSPHRIERIGDAVERDQRRRNDRPAKKVARAKPEDRRENAVGEIFCSRLNAGSADFGRVSLETGAFENLTRCPGLLSGLSFFEDFAIVTTSVPSDSSPLADLPVETQNSNCQLSIIDLRTFEIVHWLRFEGLIHELHDVVALPGMIRPMALGFESSEIHRTLSIDETRTR